MNLSSKKIAIVVDWLTNFAGAERVVKVMLETFPHADLYTTVYNSEAMKRLSPHKVYESFISKLPFSKKKHQLYLPLMPYVFEAFDLDDYDVVISSCHCCSKGILTGINTLHVCYCHSPTRYLWDDSLTYLREYGWYRWPFVNVINFILSALRRWDFIASARPDLYISNSNFVAGRIRKYYRRDAITIYPPVDLSQFDSTQPREDYYLAVGRLIPYKRFDLLVDAFNELGLPLVIVGSGKDFDVLKEKAKKNIRFEGFVPDEVLSSYYAKARAFLFPQVEDFGITPLEAMASGCPVLAYKAGGALETVNEDVGMFFETQTSESIVNVVNRYEKMVQQGKAFDPKLLSDYVQKFSTERFCKELNQCIVSALEKRHESLHH